MLQGDKMCFLKYNLKLLHFDYKFIFLQKCKHFRLFLRYELFLYSCELIGLICVVMSSTV